MKGGMWWHEADNNADRGEALVAHMDVLEQQASERYWRDRSHEQIYDNTTIDQGNYAAAMRTLAASGFSSARLNITRAIVQTIVAKLGVKRPAIKVNADNAEWSYKTKARKLTRVIRGTNNSNEMSRLSPLVLRDACIIGSGCSYIGPEHGQVIIDRVPREELFVDPRETRYGKPRSIYRRQLIDRSVLAGMYPDAAEQIGEAPEAEPWPDELLRFENAGLESDQISFYQGWHLPSGPKAKDGRWLGAVSVGADNDSGATVATKTWTRSRLPFAFQHYEKPRKGFWGRGVVEDLAGLQWKLDEGLNDVQTALYWGAQLRVWYRRGSPTPKEMLGRMRQPSAIPYDGMKPEYDAPNPVSNDLVVFIQFIIDQMSDITGVSQMRMSAKNPLGSGASAVALQEFYDIESERYSQIESMGANWWLDVDERVIDENKEIHAGDDMHAVKWSDRTVIHQIPWPKVDLDKDKYVLVLEATNFLPDTRAGKLEAAERLAERGILAPDAVSSILGGFPDLERANRMRNAPKEALEMIMEKLGDVDEDISALSPDPTMDLALGVTMCKAELNMARSEGAPEEVLSRYRDWLVLAEMLINEASKGAADKQAAQPQMPPPMPPEAGGMPPPPPGAAPPLPGGAPPMLAGNEVPV